MALQAYAWRNMPETTSGEHLPFFYQEIPTIYHGFDLKKWVLWPESYSTDFIELVE